MNSDSTLKNDESLIPKDEQCIFLDMCRYRTGGCVVLPDDGCPVYRWFKALINKEPRPG